MILTKLSGPRGVIVAVATVILMAAWPVVGALADTYSDPTNAVAVGTAGESVSAKHVAVSNGGTATAGCESLVPWTCGPSTAVSTTGNAEGYWTGVSGTGTGQGYVGASGTGEGCGVGVSANLSGRGCTYGGSQVDATATGYTSPQSSFVVSGMNDARADCREVALTMCTGGVAVSGGGYAEGRWVSIGGDNATRDSLITTNNEDPRTTAGAFDVASDMYGNTGADNFIGTYARAAAEARATLGIEESVHEMTAEVDRQVELLADTLIKNRLESETQPHVDTVNGHVDSVEQTTQCPGGTCMRSNPYDEWKDLNGEEQLVCRQRPQACYDTQHKPGEAHQMTERYYGRSGRNDASDAFRHCFLTTLLAARADWSFAYHMTRAHEFGNRNNPPRERDMDLHNNHRGLDTWDSRVGYALHARVCLAMAEEGDLWCIYRNQLLAC